MLHNAMQMGIQISADYRFKGLGSNVISSMKGWVGVKFLVNNVMQHLNGPYCRLLRE